MGIWYTTREDVMSAQDIKASAYTARDIDRAIESGARACDDLLHVQTFAPTIGTRYFDYPGPTVASVRLYLDEHPLISLTTLTSGGTAISASDYLLEPVNAGPPYRRIELNRGTSGYWQGGSTSQRAIAVAGVWGWTDDAETVGTTAEALDTVETGVDCAAIPGVGVGSLIRIDTERMVVVDKGWLATADTSVSLASGNSVQTLAVTSGAAYTTGETLLIDAERLRIVDVAGNNLTVRRAVDGTTLAAHAAAPVYAQRTLTVTRAALGTTAATHSTSATVTRWVPPALLSELNLAYAVNNLLQRQSGYARTSGTGDNQREASGRGIREIERDAKSGLGRTMRTAAV
jgi:hypothetical protein